MARVDMILSVSRTLRWAFARLFAVRDGGGALGWASRRRCERRLVVHFPGWVCGSNPDWVFFEGGITLASQENLA